MLKPRMMSKQTRVQSVHAYFTACLWLVGLVLRDITSGTIYATALRCPFPVRNANVVTCLAVSLTAHRHGAIMLRLIMAGPMLQICPQHVAYGMRRLFPRPGYLVLFATRHTILANRSKSTCESTKMKAFSLRHFPAASVSSRATPLG
jgi:hypothetical protein